MEQMTETGLSPVNQLEAKIPEASETPVREPEAGTLHEANHAEILEQNRVQGAEREHVAEQELRHDYREADGYTVLSQATLRNEDGTVARDPETGEARRIDFVVVQDGEVVRSIEVTSKTAPKDDQTAKEQRILDAGGRFVRDPDTGSLYSIPLEAKAEIWRYK